MRATHRSIRDSQETQTVLNAVVDRHSPSLILIGIMFHANTDDLTGERLRRCHFEFIDGSRLKIVLVVIFVSKANVFRFLIPIIEQLNVDGRCRTRFDVTT